ncbi:MAG: sulfate adenylyltransferase [Nitrososphaerales archaeon]
MVSAPHGGRLVQIGQSADLSVFAGFTPEQTITIGKEMRNLVANIANGVFSPLEGFMGESDYLNVIDQMRLESDVPWTIPVLLPISDQVRLTTRDEALLADQQGTPVAVIECGETFEISKKEYAMKVFGTEDGAHPGVSKVYEGSSRVMSGKLKAVARNDYGKFADRTLSPEETRLLFRERGWNTIVAFQTRNAPHINHEYLQKSALALVDGLFVNPVLGKKKSGDFTDEVILATYQALIDNYYPKGSVVLSVLHYEMQYAGPKEAIMHAIMRKNFGCTHITIGRDHAGVGTYYGPYAAQEIFKEFPDLGITPFFFREFYYCKKCGGIATERTCPHGEDERLNFSGTKLRKMFADGQMPPKEFMRPEVAQVIAQSKAPFVE